ncbi:MAG: ferrous iron transport protein B [Bacteroidales bacterium]|nr:ferrous iron transport protein B [Bacteroidales bacterium]
MTLEQLEIGQSALIKAVGGEGSRRQHFLDMGVIPDAIVKLVQYAPLGDPMELLVHGYSLTLRKEDAKLIEVAPCDEKDISVESTTVFDNNRLYISALHDHNAHPGLGEEGIYHDKDHENPLPKGTKLTFALAGQQNCGKTTLFNQLTGANQHVGNFPGVTVDRKDGVIKGHPETLVTDLPGIYSLSPYTAEERVSRQFIIEEQPKGIINIVDANNIERNLYLTMQLMELGVPMVLALNMMDEVRNNGGTILVNEMEKILGLPVVPISASKNEGVSELVDHALHVAKYQEAPVRQDFCDKDDHGGAVHRCLHSIMHLIEDHAQRAGLPLRFAASKLIEGDEVVLKALQLSQNEKDTLEHLIVQMEEERGLDRAAAMAEMRFTFIQRLCERTVVKPKESKEYQRSRRIDRILTGKWTAIPIFVLVMVGVIWLSIDALGAPLQAWLDQGIQWLSGVCGEALARWNVNPAVQSLVVDGIFGGVGSVLSFVPIIILLFFFLSLLEDSGYMARVAFVSDSFLRKLGLTGHSIVPMLIGFGCTVPAVMATRTLQSTHDRWRTILLTPFMSCSAKIPIYGFFTSVFFPGHGGLVLICLYLLGIVVGILTALVTKWLGRNRDVAPFVMELPNYRLPSAKNVAHLLWDKTKDFVQRAFTVIFLATLVIWFLQTFDFHFQMVENGEGSLLASVAGWIAPLFRPLGLGNWQVVTALISGFMAKESVVATLEVLNAMPLFTTVSSISMLVFCLLYTPCVAAIASIRRELGGKWVLFVVLFQCTVAWLCAWVAYLIANAVIG